MATRNLTNIFLEIRNATKANRHLGVKEDHHDQSGLLKSHKDQGNYKAARQILPPPWIEQIERVDEDVSKIKLKIGELSTLHIKRLMVNFESDETEQERDIESKTWEITEIFHHAEGLLKRFNEVVNHPKLTVVERTLRKNMQISMAKKLQGLSISFRAMQKQYMERLESQNNGNGSQIFSFSAEDSKKPVADFIEYGFTSVQMQELKNVEDNVDQREAEIQNIVKSIEELAQIFKELAVLVIDQGTILDRIDYNMENAVEHIQQGIGELDKAVVYQKNAMPVKCITVLVLLIIIMIGILAWKHSGK